MKLNSVPKSHSLLCSESSIFFLNIYTITFFFFFFQAEDGIRDKLVTGFRRVLFRSANQVWSYDFVSAMTHDGRTLPMLVLIEEYTRECLAIRVARRLGSYEVIEALADVLVWRGIPENIRSDNGPEFVAQELRKWL